MSLYPFQKKVYDLLMAGRSVILQAPTGAGKTRAALYPFLRAWEYADEKRPGATFPCKCIYSVPLRVLANQFWDEYEDRARNFGFCRPLDVKIQTGARPEDPKLEGNLIFTTVDQTLSNFLNIPYALSTGQANLNAGAVLGSYLVFDELHLFDPETMLPTVLHLLHLLRDVVPFLAMTATLSERMVRALAKQLGAEPIVLSAEEAAAIPSQHKVRRLSVAEEELTASAILQKHRQRSVAICNTVDRAQALFEALREGAKPDTEIRLLHSRFLQKDRATSETWLRREFGKKKDDYTVDSAILVATQVVEVGLDITSQALHTELAPAASVIQRAGRCARYKNEVGNVYVYRLPLTRGGKPNYVPYLKEQREICEKTWEALKVRSGETFDFGAELAVVNEAHGEADRHMLDRLSANRHYLVDRIAETIEAQERGAARELIRSVDSRTVFVHPDPASVEHPWAYEGFGIFRGTLFGAYEKLENLASELGEDWALMRGEARQEEESSRAPTVWVWWDVAGEEDLEGAIFVAVNPRLARYSAETGFQLGVEGDSGWQSPPRERKREREIFPPYRRETFQEHVRRMLQVYEHPFYDRKDGCQRLALVEELAYAARRLEDKYGRSSGALTRLARLIIALHDLGKLDERWQVWAHRWQKEVSVLRGQDLTIAVDYMAAHTDYDGQDEKEEVLNRKLTRMKPNHAVESARAALDYVWEQTKDEALTRAALTAIARHHSAGASGGDGDFGAHPAAPAALAEVLEEFERVQWAFPEDTLRPYLMRPDREQELLPYLLLVRALRLADQRSQMLPWKE
jgi:CRISPR-associated endonuclease/helicase Cas3